MIPRRVLLTAALLAASAARAIDGAAGTAGGASLEMGGSARALAMGGAGAAALAEPGALWVNPAGLAALEGLGGGAFLHGASFADVTVDQLAIAAPTRFGTFGGAYASTRLGEIEALDRNGGLAAVPLNPSDRSAAAAWAGRRGTLSAGAALWHLRSELASDAVASALAVDAGAVWRVTPALALGAAVQHLGTGLDYAGTRAALPLTVRGGAGFRAGATGLTLAVDGVKPADEAFGARLGAEERAQVAPGWWASVRGGWRSGTPGGGEASGVTAGAGVEWRPAEGGGPRLDGPPREGSERYGISGVRLDYAWTPMGELGSAQWFALALAF